MTHDDLRRLVWARDRARYLAAHPNHPSSWKAPVLKYDLIAPLLLANTDFIIKALQEKLGPPPDREI